MTVGTDLYMDLLLGTLRLEGRSAGTFDHRIKNFGVDLLFHLLSLQIYLTDFSQIFNCDEIYLKAKNLLVHRIEEFPIALGGMYLL